MGWPIEMSPPAGLMCGRRRVPRDAVTECINGIEVVLFAVGGPARRSAKRMRESRTDVPICAKPPGKYSNMIRSPMLDALCVNLERDGLP